MNLKKRNRTHTTDLLFTLSLFCLFAAAAFIVIMIGVHVYQKAVQNMEDTYSTRTALSYVAEKIRQHDTAGNVSLTTLDGEDALLLKDVMEEDTYLTYIYADDTALYELSVKEGAEVSAQMGDKIIEVNHFSITDRGDNFYEFSASDSMGTTVSFLLHPRSDAL